MFKNKGFITAVVFSLLLISPLIQTGLGLKQFTRLNEIVLALAALFIFMAGVAKGQIGGLKTVERWLALLGFSYFVSIFWGYCFLQIIPTYVDFFQILNFFLFGLYFRAGTFFTAKAARNPLLGKMIYSSIVGLNILSISQLFPWGVEYVLPFYLPAKYYEQARLASLWSGTIGRIPGIVGTPTTFSLVMVFLISIITSWSIYKSQKNLKIIFLLLLSMITLLLTFGRSGILAFFISQLFLLGSAWKKYRVGVNRIILIYLVFAFAAFSAMAIVENAFHVRGLRGFRFELLFYNQEGGGSYQGRGDIGNRFLLWGKGIEKGMISPVFGWGPENGNNIIAEKSRDLTLKGFYGAHNEFVDVFMQTGLIGLLLTLILFIRIFLKANALCINQDDPHSLCMARGVQTIIIAVVVFDLFDGFWFSPIAPAIMMMMIGAMYSIDKQNTSQKIRWSDNVSK